MSNKREKSRIKKEENPIPKNKLEEEISSKKLDNNASSEYTKEDNEPLPQDIKNDEPIPLEIQDDEPFPLEIEDGEPIPLEIQDDEPFPIEIQGDETFPLEIQGDETFPLDIQDDEPFSEEIQDDEPFPEEIDGTILSGKKNSENTIDYHYEYDSERSYVFIFGPSAVGKTVIIGSILKYLKVYRSKTYGDTLKNINNKDIIHEREGNLLWRDLTKANTENKFPFGTVNIESSKENQNNPAPRHLNLHFLPANQIPDFKFCFLDMAGEDLSKLDYESEKPLPETIETYLEDVPKQNMCFIFVVDPQCSAATKSEQIVLFDAFIERLDSNDHTETPLLILVSKWDTVKDQFDNVEQYLEDEFEDILATANQANRNISFAEFSIGKVDVLENRPLSYDHSYPERVFNWLYKNQIGKSLIAEENKIINGNWISRLLKSLKRK